MPNTGRFYAPAAAAAYRERYMRPYSTVSAPLGAHAHAAAAASPKVPAPAFSRAAPSRRPDGEVFASFATTYESRVRGRPSASFDRTVDDERRWSVAPEKQFTKQQRAWANEEMFQRETSRDAVSSNRQAESRHQEPFARVTDYDAAMGLANRGSYEAPSALPTLSSLLQRSSNTESPDLEERLANRKRVHEFSPTRDDEELPAKMTRRFYDNEASAERSYQSKFTDAVREKRDSVYASTLQRREPPMEPKCASAYETLGSQQYGRPPQAVSPSPPRDYAEHTRYLYSRIEPSVAERSNPQSRRPIAPSHNDSVVGREYGNETRAFELERLAYYSRDSQREHSAPAEPDSPPATRVKHDAHTSARRYSEGKEGDCVIEAAADLVEERSPSKRESITKLLLKSKDFLKAKSLVRNRNNEIDWVATFLNVGFESNSIYSLMCPLRKGRWKVEEEKYTMELLRLIESGTIRLRHGQSIRGFIAKKLHSDDMRVLKKLSNCKMFHFARLINPRMSDVEEVDDSLPGARASLDRLEKLKADFLRSVQLEALVAVRKYLSDTSIRDLLNARD